MSPGFFDIFSQEEIDYCEALQRRLQPVQWGSRLLSRVREGGLTIENRPTFFELMIAGELVELGITEAVYEWTRNEVPGSVDFHFEYCGREWLLEAVHVSDSAVVLDATYEQEVSPGITIGELSLSSSNEDRRLSDAGEMLRIQEKILEKVYDRRRKRAIKFPPIRDHRVHVLVVDVRRFLLGHLDEYDAGQIGFGPRAAGAFAQYWSADGKERPVFGLFQEEHPSPGAKILQERVHFVLLSPVRRFTQGGLFLGAFLLANPSLLSESCIHELLGSWPGPCKVKLLCGQ